MPIRLIGCPSTRISPEVGSTRLDRRSRAARSRRALLVARLILFQLGSLGFDRLGLRENEVIEVEPATAARIPSILRDGALLRVQRGDGPWVRRRDIDARRGEPRRASSAGPRRAL